MTLSVTEYHDIKMLCYAYTACYAYVMLNNATGMCIHDDVSV